MTPEIDLVYLYVNSSDPVWLEGRRKFSDDFNNGPWRYRDNEELRWSLRSVEKYAPWVRNIYIVSNSSMPDWLNTAHEKIHVVDHGDIMPEELLPCYNCNVIERYICEIPGLSEFFLYANDDTFFGYEVKPDFFVRNGKPVVRMQKMGFDPENPKEYFHRIVANAFFLSRRHYGRGFRYMPWHTIDIYSRSAMKRCNSEFSEELKGLSGNRLRTDDDIQRVIYQYDLLQHEECYLRVYDRSTVFRKALHTLQLILSPPGRSDFAVCGMHLLFRIPFLKDTMPRKTRCVCLNDDEWTGDADLKKYRKLMESIYPERSSFERPANCDSELRS